MVTPLDSIILLVHAQHNGLTLLRDKSVIELGENVVVALVVTGTRSDELALHPDLVPVLDIADVEAHESFDEVLITHPELTITFIQHRSDFLLHLTGPLVTSI